MQERAAQRIRVVEPQASASELMSVLSRSDAEVERHASMIHSLLKGASAAELREVAPRLLALLRNPVFGRAPTEQVPSLRPLFVESVLTAGYPWALELSGEDVEALRREARAGRGARRWVFGVGAVLVSMLALLAARPLGATRVESFPERAPIGPERTHEAPPLTIELSREVDDASPGARIGLLVDSMHRATTAARDDDDVISIGLDCLAIDSPESWRCLTTLGSFLDRRGRGGDVAALELATRLYSVSTDAFLRGRKERARGLVGLLRARVPFGHGRESLASDAQRREAAAAFWSAQASLSAGDAAAAITFAEQCLEANPQELDCHRAALAGHEAMVARSVFREAQQHLDAAARAREAIATALAHRHRVECEQGPAGASRAIACP